MYIIVNHSQVKPEHREAYIEAILDDARCSLRDEPGCIRFDVMQDRQDPNSFHLCAVYRDEDAFDAHVRAPHLRRYQEATRDILAAPATAWRCVNILPADQDWR